MKKKSTRLYAPFVKLPGERKWTRATYPVDKLQPDDLPPIRQEIEFPAYPKDQAIRVYQSWLLFPFQGGTNEVRELRPLPVEKEHICKTCGIKFVDNPLITIGTSFCSTHCGKEYFA
jgi:hypothetical protein